MMYLDLNFMRGLMQLEAARREAERQRRLEGEVDPASVGPASHENGSSRSRTSRFRNWILGWFRLP